MALIPEQHLGTDADQAEIYRMSIGSTFQDDGFGNTVDTHPDTLSFRSNETYRRGTLFYWDAVRCDNFYTNTSVGF